MLGEGDNKYLNMNRNSGITMLKVKFYQTILRSKHVIVISPITTLIPEDSKLR